LKKTGVPPTALKARTGEFTPPGISSMARANKALLSVIEYDTMDCFYNKMIAIFGSSRIFLSE
jgi:hypothetical protein